MAKTLRKSRSIHVKKYRGRYQLVVKEYFGMRLGKALKYPEFSKTFTKRRDAVSHARTAARKVEKRFPSVRFVTRFLND